METRARRFVVGLDRSELGLLALDHAIELARERDAELHVVFVYQPLGDATNLFGGPADPAMEHELEKLLPVVRERVEKGPRVVQLHGVIGPAADALVQVAAVIDADAIFVGTHGRTGLQRALLGSVAEKVARRAGCSVIVVRSRVHEIDARFPTHHKERIVRA